MTFTKFVIVSLAVVLVTAEPPSPYHYNRPQPVPLPAQIQPGFLLPQVNPGPSFSQGPNFGPSLPSGSYGAPPAFPTNQQPSFAQPPRIPSTSYGFPQTPLPSFNVPAIRPAPTYAGPSNNGFLAQGTNQNLVVSNAIGNSALIDGELKNTIETILLREESRANAEYVSDDGARVVSILMDGPRPALNVAQFVLPGQASGGFVSQGPQFNVPASVYGPAH